MSYTVGYQDIEEGVDTGLSANAKIRESFINTQTALNSIDTRLLASEKFESEFMTPIFTGASMAPSQEPTVVDTALQVEFGSAQNDSSDDAKLAVDGTITFNTAATYLIKLKAHCGTATASVVAFRWLVNSVMVGTPIVTIMPNDSVLNPIESELLVTADAGDVLTAEVIRDSAGTNDGGLMSMDVTASGWGVARSAEVSVRKLF